MVPDEQYVEMLPLSSQALPGADGVVLQTTHQSWRHFESLQATQGRLNLAMEQVTLGGRFLGLYRLQWVVILLHVLLLADLLFWDTYLQTMLKGAFDFKRLSWHDTVYTVSAFGVCFLAATLHGNLFRSDPGWVLAGSDLEEADGPQCQYCGVRAPLRSRHCFISGRCVAAFDHYCDLLATPVGVRNHRRFWVYLLVQSFVTLWGMIIAWFAVGGCLAPSVIRDPHSHCWSEQPGRSTVLLMTAMLLTALTSLFGSLWLLHTYFVSTAQTTYEILKGANVSYLSGYYAAYTGPHSRQLPYSKIWPEIVRRLAVGNPPPAPFSEGFVRNWEVFLFDSPECHKAQS